MLITLWEILKIYALVGVAVALSIVSLHLTLRKRLDRPYPLWELLFFMPFEALFWPFCIYGLYRAESLTKFCEKNELFKLASREELEALEQERQEMYRNPPFCGSYIYMVGSGFRGLESSNSIFIFTPNDVKKHFQKQAMVENQSFFEEEDAILRWAERADESVEVCCQVPQHFFGRFRYVAMNLIKEGRGQCFCQNCNIHYPNTDISARQEIIVSFLTELFHCPAGHLVMSVERMHCHFRLEEA